MNVLALRLVGGVSFQLGKTSLRLSRTSDADLMGNLTSKPRPYAYGVDEDSHVLYAPTNAPRRNTIALPRAC